MIELWDGYAITADNYCFILGKPVVRAHKQRGHDEHRFQDATYHGTLTQALAAFHRTQLRDYTRDNTGTLAQALQVSAQIENRIRELLPEANFERPDGREGIQE